MTEWVVITKDQGGTQHALGPFPGLPEAQSTARRVALKAKPGCTQVLQLQTPPQHATPQTLEVPPMPPQVVPVELPPLVGKGGVPLTREDVEKGQEVGTPLTHYGDRLNARTPCCGRIQRPLKSATRLQCPGCLTKFQVRFTTRFAWWRRITPRKD